MLKNVGKLAEKKKNSRCTKMENNSLSPKEVWCDKTVFIWNQAWLRRQDCLLIYFSASVFPPGNVQMWEQKVWRAGTVLQHCELNVESLKCATRKHPKGRRIVLIASEWCSDQMPGSVGKNTTDSRWTVLLSLYEEFLNTHCVLKCLNHSLSVKLNIHFSCRDGYLYLCVTLK